MHKNQKTILKAILVLSILGLITSLYLVQSHYAPPGEGSLCDISESISCSAVTHSQFGELLGVPVAIFGVMWFIVLMSLAWKSLKRRGDLITFMLSWLGLGILFVIYLIIAEIILRTLCPFCTVVHLIIIMAFVLALLLYKSQEDPASKSFMKIPKSWFKAILIVNIIIIIIFNVFSPGQAELDELAQCMTENGVVMYSSFQCGVCIQSENLFGDAMQYINRVECHPNGKNSQTQRCLDKNLSGTPTWILEKDGKEVKRQPGFMTIEMLKEFSGCG